VRRGDLTGHVLDERYRGLRWPHVSVATLVPAGPIVAPWP
jgi:hypothetical protein